MSARLRLAGNNARPLGSGCHLCWSGFSHSTLRISRTPSTAASEVRPAARMWGSLVPGRRRWAAPADALRHSRCTTVGGSGRVGPTFVPDWRVIPAAVPICDQDTRRRGPTPRRRLGQRVDRQCGQRLVQVGVSFRDFVTTSGDLRSLHGSAGGSAPARGGFGHWPGSRSASTRPRSTGPALPPYDAPPPNDSARPGARQRTDLGRLGWWWNHNRGL